MPVILRSLLPAALLVASAACGGGGDSGPKPLTYHFDDYHIARVPIGERQAVFKAQNEYHVAKGEHVTAQTQMDDNGTRREVAKNELKQALLAEKSAKTKLAQAEDTADMNRVNTAKAELRAAEMERRAADQKVVAVKAERKWLKLYVRYTEENMYAKEAAFELAKANVAQQKNIRPKGFDITNFRAQSQERSRRAQRAKAVSDSEKKKFEGERKKYMEMKKAAERAGGGKSAQ